MNKQLLRMKQRSNGDILQVAQSDDSNNLYVNVDAGTLNEVEHVTNVDSVDLITEVSNISDVDSVNLVDRITLIDTVTEVANVTSVDLVDEVNKSVSYGQEHDGVESPIHITDEGAVWIKNIQDAKTFEDSYMMMWPDNAAQYTGFEHVYSMPTDYTYDKHYIYVANPSPNTTLQLSVRNEVPIFGGTLYGEIFTVAVPAAAYEAFSDVAWSGAFSSIGGVLTDLSADMNDVGSGSGDAAFLFGAVDDALYLGADAPFQRLRMNVGTAGVYDASGVWEYWNGSAWTAVPEVFDMSNGSIMDGTKSFTQTGSRYIQWQIPADWAAYDIPADPVSRYWVRWRITSFTSRTSGPVFVQGTYKRVGKANVHGYLIEGLFNGGDIKITLENNTAVTYGFPAEIYLRSV